MSSPIYVNRHGSISIHASSSARSQHYAVEPVVGIEYSEITPEVNETYSIASTIARFSPPGFSPPPLEDLERASAGWQEQEQLRLLPHASTMARFSTDLGLSPPAYSPPLQAEESSEGQQEQPRVSPPLYSLPVARLSPSRLRAQLEKEGSAPTRGDSAAHPP